MSSSIIEVDDPQVLLELHQGRFFSLNPLKKFRASGGGSTGLIGAGLLMHVLRNATPRMTWSPAA